MNKSWCRGKGESRNGNTYTGDGNGDKKGMKPTGVLPPKSKPDTVRRRIGGNYGNTMGYKTAELKAPGFPPGIRVSEGKPIEVSVSGMRVVLSQVAFEQLFGWAYAVGREITCLGVVNKTGDCEFEIERFYLAKQEGSGASSELNETAVAELIEGMMNDGKKDEAVRIKCWAHSHPNLGVFWSNIDTATCELLLSDYLISIVVSNNYAIRCRIDIRSPFKISFDCVPVYYAVPETKTEIVGYTEEAKKLVESINYAVAYKPTTKYLPVVSRLSDQADNHYYCEYCGEWHLDGQCEIAEGNLGFDGEYEWYTLGADTMDDADDDIMTANEQCVQEILKLEGGNDDRDLPPLPF